MFIDELMNHIKDDMRVKLIIDDDEIEKTHEIEGTAEGIQMYIRGIVKVVTVEPDGSGLKVVCKNGKI